jgi:hypothetical protein
VVPEIEKLTEFLLDVATKLGDALETGYEDAAMDIRIRAFEKCNSVFQLAYVLTPAGRENAQRRHSNSPIPSTLAKIRDHPDREPSAHGGSHPLLQIILTQAVKMIH